MSFTAIVGAGPLGGALAQRLASRDRIRRIRLIDTEGRIAQGKALDIMQSAPVEGFSGRVEAAESIEAAAGADVIVIADPAVGDGDHSGEAGLALMRRLASLDTDAPLLFAGAGQRQLMERTVSELRVEPRRAIGSAPGALQSAVRALTALEVNGTGVDVQLLVLGVPPHAALVAWEEATAFGQPVGSLVPPHRLAGISALLPGLWPPGPQALASAAARVAEAVVMGSRRRFTCFVSLDEPPVRGAVVALPAQIGPRGVEAVLHPALSRQEQTKLENGRTPPA
ncbi:malate dehydrogenase [soil metagenome]